MATKKKSYKNNPIFWFAILCDSERAMSCIKFAEAYQELKRLGVLVKFTKGMFDG